MKPMKKPYETELDSLRNLMITSTSAATPPPKNACGHVMLPRAGSWTLPNFGASTAAASATPIRTARMENSAPGSCQPLALALAENSPKLTLTLYHGKNDAISNATPAPAISFSPVLNSLILSIFAPPTTSTVADVERNSTSQHRLQRLAAAKG